MKRDRKWVRGVKTVSTYPPPGTFTKKAEEVARIMARRDVSPRGITSGIRMIQFYINRAGRTLPANRQQELKKAIRLLQKRSKSEERGSRSNSTAT